MKKARVADMAARHCAKLSKGYRQRVGLAQAIIHNPDVLILDEPTAGLDPKQSVETRELIRELGGSHTIVLSSHILSEVADTCQRVVIINKGKRGRRRYAGQPDAAAEGLGHACICRWRRPAEDVQAALGGIAGVTRVGVAPKARRHRSTSKSTASRTATSAASWPATVVGRGWGLLELRPMQMGLEDIYLKLTEDEAAASGRRPNAAETGRAEEVAHA